MELFPASGVSYNEVDPENFTGEATVGRILGVDYEGEVRIFRVTFQAFSRTNWHIHTGLQILLVEEGNGKVQKKDGNVLEIGLGDTVYVQPGEMHWHGASPKESMTHLAVNFGGHTDWLKSVTDEDYSGMTGTMSERQE